MLSLSLESMEVGVIPRTHKTALQQCGQPAGAQM